MLRIKIGNPVIVTEKEAEDIDKYERLDAVYNTCVNVEECVVGIDGIRIKAHGKFKTTKYSANPSLFWVVEKLKAANDNTSITDRQIETKRLMELATKHNLL